MRWLLRLLRNKRTWATVGLLSVLAFFAALVTSGVNHHEFFPLTLLFGGHLQKQLFFALGLGCFALFAVPVSSKFSNLFRPKTLIPLVLGFLFWWANERYGHPGPPQRIFNFREHPAIAGALPFFFVTLSRLVGLLYVVQAPLKRSTHLHHLFGETWLFGRRKGKDHAFER